MHTSQPRPFVTQTTRQHGLTLIELMVAMVIGLFLIGGVIGVFVANQQTSNTKQQLDRAQENFRFGSQTLMRVIRQGTGIDAASTGTELIVDFAGGPGTHDCVGTTAGGPNSFRVDGQSRLVCTDSGGVDHVLIADVAAIDISFGIDANDDGLIDNDEYVAHTDVADWTQVGSVRAALTLANGQQLPFTATMRPMIVAAFSAPATSAPPGNDEDAGQDDDNGGTGGGDAGDDGSGGAGGGAGGGASSGGDAGGSEGPYVCTTTVSGTRKNFTVSVQTPAGQAPCSHYDSKGARTYSCTIGAAAGAAITLHHAQGNGETKSTTANCASRTINFG